MSDERMTEDDERFDKAMSMINSLLNHIRDIEGSVFNFQEDLDNHLAYMLFYSHVKMYDPDSAEEMFETARNAIEAAQKDTSDENTFHSEDMELRTFH